jgi:hypothetical protein
MDVSDLDQFWEDILSCDPARIRRAWGNLTDAECLAVLEHLRRMTEAEEWQPEQREAAATALRVLREQAA